MSRNLKAKAPSTESREETAAMAETAATSAELAGISTEAITELTGIKQRQHVIRGYRARAEELRGQVSNVVHQRVTRDYERREAELESQARPLRADARKEYAKLRAVHEQLQRAFDEVSLDKQELEFRHAVGELGPDELNERLQELERLLERRRDVLSQAEQLKQQFIAAFDSPEELESEPKVSTASREIPPSAPPPAVDAADPVSAAPPAQPAPPVEPVVAADPDPVDDEPTPPVPPPFMPPVSDETMCVDALAAPIGDNVTDAADETFVVPEAVLVVQQGETPTAHRLSVLNYIGRTKDNHVQIAFPGVSRRHALVSAGPGGFTLADLGSQNGTFVNEQPITQCTLNQGDRIKIGEVELVFRLLHGADA